MEENQFLNKKALVNLSQNEKEKYKIFLMNIIKLSRDTKRIKLEKPNIPNIELPHLIISDKNNLTNIFTFSIEENCWKFNIENSKNLETFNPKAINGILEILENFDLIELQLSTELYQDEINELSLKYGVTYK